MIERQVDIFEIISSTKFDEALSKLEKYGVDEYYRNHFKGKSELLMTISNTLSQIDNYEEYNEKLYEILKEYFKDSIEIKVRKNADYIRIQSSKSRSDYPIYCLEMIKKEDR